MNADNPQSEIVCDIASPDFEEPTHKANEIFVGSLIYRQDKIRVAYIPSRSRDFYLLLPSRHSVTRDDDGHYYTADEEHTDGN